MPRRPATPAASTHWPPGAAAVLRRGDQVLPVSSRCRQGLRDGDAHGHHHHHRRRRGRTARRAGRDRRSGRSRTGPAALPWRHRAGAADVLGAEERRTAAVQARPCRRGSGARGAFCYYYAPGFALLRAALCDPGRFLQQRHLRAYAGGRSRPGPGLRRARRGTAADPGRAVRPGPGDHPRDASNACMPKVVRKRWTNS